MLRIGSRSRRIAPALALCFRQGKDASMRLTCDHRHNIAYIRLRERRAEVETLRVSDELNIDIAPDGTVYGIELLNANEQLSGDGGRLVVVDESGGKERSVKLATGTGG